VKGGTVRFADGDPSPQNLGHQARRGHAPVRGFDISPERRSNFPSLGERRRTVNLPKDDQVFVREI
jgi:hypothetical protein